MENFTSLQVTATPNGIVRIYGNGGMVFEGKGDYVRIETSIDPKPALPSGEAVQSVK